MAFNAGNENIILRMEHHEKNAKEIVQFLTNHESITEVLYPGSGGMISFRIPDRSMGKSISTRFKAYYFC